jgi:hypothetical protein
MLCGITFGLALGAASGFIFGVAGGIVAGLAAWLSVELKGKPRSVQLPRWRPQAGDLMFGTLFGIIGIMLFGTAGGPAFGVAGGTAAGLGGAFGMAARRGRTREPSGGIHWQLRVTDLIVGVTLGMSVGLALAITATARTGLISGLTLSFCAVLVLGLRGVPNKPTDAASPDATLIRDRGAAAVAMLVAGLAFGLVAGVPTGLVAGLKAGMIFGATTGFNFGLNFGLFETMWGSFVLARVFLALSSRLPWKLMMFLADAHDQRGVLRQVGAVYQFRHAELQHRLAGRRHAAPGSWEL